MRFKADSYCANEGEPFPRPFCANFLLPDHLLFGLRGEIKVFKGVMRGWEWGLHRRRKWNLNLTSAGSAVSLLQLHTEEQTAPAIHGLNTSGRACHSARRGAGRRRVLATVKGQQALKAGSVQLSESLTTTQSTPTMSQSPPGSHSTPTQASGEAQGWLDLHRSFWARYTAWMEGQVLFFNIEVHFTCHTQPHTAF